MYDRLDASRDARGGRGDAVEPRQRPIHLRPAREVRIVEHAGAVVAFPGPHRTPILPSGWAPLGRDEQVAVLRACDARPDAVLFRLGSLWDVTCEYRVYRLAREHWAGLSIVAKHVAGPAGVPGTQKSEEATARQDAGTGEAGTPPTGNVQLIGLAWDVPEAVRIAVDFFNWDLEAHGESWRLGLQAANPAR